MVTDPIKFVYKVGDGVTTDFSYAYNGTVGFDADVAEDVRAAILNPDGTRDTNPNFAVLKDTYGNFTGAIRFATAPVANAVVYIYRATPQTQETEYKTSSGFDAKNVENDFDKLTKLVQETSSHARNKTLQLDMFQEVVLKLVLTSAANQNQMMYVDWATHTIRFTPFTKGQTVITPAAGQDDKAALMLKINYDENGKPYLNYSLNQGADWIAVVAPDVQVLSQVLGDYRQLLPSDDDVQPATFVDAINAERTDRRAAFNAEITSDDLAGDDTPPTAGTWSLWNAIKKIFANMVWAIKNIKKNAIDIAALQGIGGALTATDLGANPTQESLTTYAIDQIWPGHTDLVWNAADPAASTFTDADGIARTAAEIFNGTWVNNLNTEPAQAGHKWQLVNTQDTDPKVFLWTDVGQAIVSIASPTLAGVVRGAGQVIVDAATGDMSLDSSKAAAIRTTINALAKFSTSSGNKRIYAQDAGGNLIENLYLLEYGSSPGAFFNGRVPAYGGTNGASITVGTPTVASDATPKSYVDNLVTKNNRVSAAYAKLAVSQENDITNGVGVTYYDNNSSNVGSATISLGSNIGTSVNNFKCTKEIRIRVGGTIPSLTWSANYNDTSYPIKWVDDSLATISDANKTTIFVVEFVKAGSLIEFVANRAGVY